MIQLYQYREMKLVDFIMIYLFKDLGKSQMIVLHLKVKVFFRGRFAVFDRALNIKPTVVYKVQFQQANVLTSV